MEPIQVTCAGTVPYAEAWDWQKRIVQELSASPAASDQLLLLEHPPTYTMGRSGSLDNLLLPQSALKDKGFTLHWVDRGGDITYHGPGQLVGYPILNLKRLYSERGRTRPDLHNYLRDVEEVVIQALACWHLRGWRYPGYTGVWVDGRSGPEKIAAIGIKVNGRGISNHGFAINVNPNMNHFAHIIPCGIGEHGVTSLTDQLQQTIIVADLIQPIMQAFRNVFAREPIPLAAPEAT